MPGKGVVGLDVEGNVGWVVAVVVDGKKNSDPWYKERG